MHQWQAVWSVQAPVPVVALVGYTNAGKSTLLNKVTEASVLAEDKLFATLDPTTRRVSLPSSKEVCMYDFQAYMPSCCNESCGAGHVSNMHACILSGVRPVADRHAVKLRFGLHACWLQAFINMACLYLSTMFCITVP